MTLCLSVFGVFQAGRFLYYTGIKTPFGIEEPAEIPASDKSIRR